jgi:hypothetical protein
LVASNPGADSTTQTVSGQWGSYSATLGAATGGNATPGGGDGAFRRAVLLAEGDYTGAAPTIDLVTTGATATAVNYFTSASTSAGASASQIVAQIPFFIPEPATLTLFGLAVAFYLGCFRSRTC